jgi:hypothetical protein
MSRTHVIKYHGTTQNFLLGKIDGVNGNGLMRALVQLLFSFERGMRVEKTLMQTRSRILPVSTNPDVPSLYLIQTVNGPPTMVMQNSTTKTLVCCYSKDLMSSYDFNYSHFLQHWNMIEYPLHTLVNKTNRLNSTGAGWQRWVSTINPVLKFSLLF